MGETSALANSVQRLSEFQTAFTLDLVVSNNSMGRTVTIAEFWLEIPWRDDMLRPLDDPAEMGGSKLLYSFRETFWSILATW